jgi:cholesterol 7-dehydrogenase
MNSFIDENKYLVFFMLSILILFIYWFYVSKLKVYKWSQQFDPKLLKSRPRGQCPPFFPNGWFRICNSDDLKVNHVRHVEYFGRSIVIFRDINHQVYGMNSFCEHVEVIDGHYIQCPSCMQPDSLKRCCDENTKLKRYTMKEINDSILIWLDSRDEYHDTVLYQPFLLEHNLEFRGESVHYVNCHIQEIPENGADIRHFDFVHSSFLDAFPFIKVHWNMLSERATEPDLLNKMKHDNEEIQKFKWGLIQKYITDENKQYVNVISLSCYLIFFEKHKLFLFNGTGFQVGPGIVYLILKSKFFEMILFQSIVPMAKFCQKVTHKFYTNSYIPYFLSAFFLVYGEAQQFMNDMRIWNHKQFGSNLCYNLKTEADRKLLKWRNWYSQFYDGCYEFEKGNEQRKL